MNRLELWEATLALSMGDRWRLVWDLVRSIFWPRIPPGQSKPVDREPINFAQDPFVGMWLDRPEMRDSARWKRNLRESRWGG